MNDPFLHGEYARIFSPDYGDELEPYFSLEIGGRMLSFDEHFQVERINMTDEEGKKSVLNMVIFDRDSMHLQKPVIYMQAQVHVHFGHRLAVDTRGPYEVTMLDWQTGRGGIILDFTAEEGGALSRTSNHATYFGLTLRQLVTTKLKDSRIPLVVEEDGSWPGLDVVIPEDHPLVQHGNNDGDFLRKAVGRLGWTLTFTDGRAVLSPPYYRKNAGYAFIKFGGADSDVSSLRVRSKKPKIEVAPPPPALAKMIEDIPDYVDPLGVCGPVSDTGDEVFIQKADMSEREKAFRDSGLYPYENSTGVQEKWVYGYRKQSVRGEVWGELPAPPGFDTALFDSLYDSLHGKPAPRRMGVVLDDRGAPYFVPLQGEANDIVPISNGDGGVEYAQIWREGVKRGNEVTVFNNWEQSDASGVPTEILVATNLPPEVRAIPKVAALFKPSVGLTEEDLYYLGHVAGAIGAQAPGFGSDGRWLGATELQKPFVNGRRISEPDIEEFELTLKFGHPMFRTQYKTLLSGLGRFNGHYRVKRVRHSFDPMFSTVLTVVPGWPENKTSPAGQEEEVLAAYANDECTPYYNGEDPGQELPSCKPGCGVYLTPDGEMKMLNVSDQRIHLQDGPQKEYKDPDGWTQPYPAVPGVPTYPPTKGADF